MGCSEDTSSTRSTTRIGWPSRPGSVRRWPGSRIEHLVVTKFASRSPGVSTSTRSRRWQQLRTKLLAKHRFDPQMCELPELLRIGAHECRARRAGPHPHPAAPADYAGIKRDVMFTGDIDMFRIWDTGSVAAQSSRPTSEAFLATGTFWARSRPVSRDDIWTATCAQTGEQARRRVTGEGGEALRQVAWRRPPMSTTRRTPGRWAPPMVPVMVAEVVGWLRPRPGARLVDGPSGSAATPRPCSPPLPIRRSSARSRPRRARRRPRAGSPPSARASPCARRTFADLPALLADDRLGRRRRHSPRPRRQLSAARRSRRAASASAPRARSTCGWIRPAELERRGHRERRWDEGDARRRDLRELRRGAAGPRASRAPSCAPGRSHPRATSPMSSRASSGAARRVCTRRRGPSRRSASRVNDELGALDAFLADGWTLLRPGGRLADPRLPLARGPAA